MRKPPNIAEEQIRADAAQLFHDLLTERSDIDAALAAAAHLPGNRGNA
jgi:hypothetical protein